MKSLKELLGREPKIGYFTNFLNEKEALEKGHLGQMKDLDFDARIYVDGKYPKFPMEGSKSTDGSIDIIKQLSNTYIIDGGELTEMEKNNLAFKKAGELQIDLLLQIDADEWVDYDRATLIESFEQESKSVNTFQFMTRFTNHWSSPPRVVNHLPRLFFKPEFITSDKIHWWFYSFGVRIVVDPVVFIEGAHIHHDDRLRTIERNEMMDKYQEGNMRREVHIIKKEMGDMATKIGSHKHEYDFRIEGGRKCYICHKPKHV